LAAVVALASACAGDGPGGGTVGDFAAIQREIFDQSCVLAACHSATTRAGGLSLAQNESYGQLVDVPPDNGVARQAGLLRVAPSSVETSFLVKKVTGDLTAGEGDLMPLGAAPLQPSQIAQIEEWIAAGAPADTLEEDAALAAANEER
jgi:hypothetical protein